MYEKEENERRIREKLRETRKIKLFIQHPAANSITESKLECNSSMSLKEVTHMAYKVWNSFIASVVFSLLL